MLLSQINLYKSGKEKSYLSLDILWWPSSKDSAGSVGDLASIPGSGRSLEKEMAIHSNILACRIP